jgi:hypothetical protein
MIKKLTTPTQRTVTIHLTPFQWRIVKKAAKEDNIRAKHFQDHAAYLLQEALSDLVEGGEFYTGPVGYLPSQWNARKRRVTASARAKWSRYKGR